ncbi:beta-N-acetylhexosaminidase [Nitrosomonas sp. Nm58]|jgi:beta-N-acetylhexosaminidase|uniref:beta-N-acetylhexosaminidase n=1 Tax=Nitrosomonas sp. Nm58 TaxID=200126 RepID=UPI000898A474|nr:beta-N-acetylhexosaminidase [Nitrosomonas sp. Nm58]SDY50070.1 beta-N-acetylhexosaminidase [Nitrosomonas sp. Nm58]
MSLGPVMLDIVSTQLSVEDKARLRHPLTGGVILFTRNYESCEQLTALTAEIHALRNPPLLVAVDHEGGRVQRFRKDFTPLPAMRELGKIWDRHPHQARHLAKQTGYVLAAELSTCGVDLSFTPVLDIDYGQSSVIGDRAFHRTPQAIAELAHSLMLGLKSGGMAAVGKHFPGHGHIQADTHFEIAMDDRTYADIEMDDLIPFRQMINFGLAGIMAAHVIYPKMDGYPAGFSSFWLKNILRNELGFDGCIFSDDLSMQGTAGYGNITERARAALQAGCDMVLVCNDFQSADQLLETLQWEIPAVSLARLAHMRGRRHAQSMIKLHEAAYFVQAVREISEIGVGNQELSF